MKQISQNYKSGDIKLESVEVPALRPGGILVRTAFSVISAGTEGMKVREGKMNYLEKARARPDQVKKVLQSVEQQGLAATYRKVMNKLDSLSPLGYSLSGIVEAVGQGAPQFTVGQRVACAGAGYANHADVNYVPKNLVVAVPDGVRLEHAAYATIGAISLQAVRQSEIVLGETACVIGLGLLGQILVQILRAAGVTVIGLDPSADRCRLAMQLGARDAMDPDDSGLKTRVMAISRGRGCDSVFIAAGVDSNGPLETAIKVARDRAKIVSLGKTKLDVPWKEFFERELELRFSRSYGPGRYDPSYEEGGNDYPIGYVRWTENRNMEAFLDLVADGKVQLDPIITEIRPFEDAETVYQELAEQPGKVVSVVFEFPINPATPATEIRRPASRTHRPTAKVRLGVIGAGNYASSMLLPHLARNESVRLVEVVTNSGLSGANAARKFPFERTSTDANHLIESSDIDAVIIATRHSTHASLTARALETGKAVFVEKPLAIDYDGVRQIEAAVAKSGNDRLQVGFNRRFSPHVLAVARHFITGRAPLTMTYRVHAGQLDAGSWYLDASHGSRFNGEAGHFIDVMSFLAGGSPTSVFARRGSAQTADDMDNVTAVITFADGSVGTLLYLTQGGTKVPKEYLEVFGMARTAQMENFEELRLYSGTKSERSRSRSIDKGQSGELAAFIKAIATGEPMPIDLRSLFNTTLVTLAAEESIRENRAIEISEAWARIRSEHR